MSKFLSRKFLLSLSAFVTGVGMIVAGDTDAQTITGTVLALASVITYVFGEAKVDAAAVNTTGKTTEGEPKVAGEQ